MTRLNTACYSVRLSSRTLATLKQVAQLEGRTPHSVAVQAIELVLDLKRPLCKKVGDKLQAAEDDLLEVIQ